jgi:RNA-directed DNA polymerase
VNRQKSAIARPWQRVFLGYSFTSEKKARLRVPHKSVIRFKKKLKAEFRKGRGRNIGRLINENLNPKIRGWVNYFRHVEVKDFAENLDGWIRRHLRKVKWKQWKRAKTRFRELLRLGLNESQARKSAGNGRGSWWNSGSSHMNLTLRKKYFDKIGLISILDVVLEFRKH